MVQIDTLAQSGGEVIYFRLSRCIGRVRCYLGRIRRMKMCKILVGIVAMTVSSFAGASEIPLASWWWHGQDAADPAAYAPKLDFLVANGRNPWGMVMAFEKLNSMSDGQASPSYVQKLFSSHPDTKKRIEKMTKRCNKDGYQRPAAQ